VTILFSRIKLFLDSESSIFDVAQRQSWTFQCETKGGECRSSDGMAVNAPAARSEAKHFGEQDKTVNFPKRKRDGEKGRKYD
tara:strand:- start:153 stop:398 length:246 start_codon:yes stop_codon:yes gene_type:complete